MRFHVPPHYVFVALLFAILSNLPSSAHAQAVSEAQRQELTRRLSSYDSCNLSCAEDLVVLTCNEGVADALAVLGLAKGGGTLLKGPVKYLSLYAVFQKIKASGGKIVDTYKVCAQSCDDLYRDIAELSSAGLLGPITKQNPIPETWFNDPKVQAIWDKYIRPLKPSDLPAQFQNDARWKEIMNTG